MKRAGRGGRFIWTEEDDSFLRDNYMAWTHARLAAGLGVSKNTITRRANKLGLSKRTAAEIIAPLTEKPVPELLREMHHDRKMSILAMAQELGVSRKAIGDLMDRLGISRRRASDAQRSLWQQRTAEQRRQQVDAAHKATREQAKRGEHPFQILWATKREECVAQARINCLAMTKNRKRNGMKGRTGPKHHLWNPVRTKEHRTKFRKTEEHYAWVRAVYERDNYTCQLCGFDKGKTLNAHHLNSYADYPDQRTLMENGITLCRKCHRAFHQQHGYGHNTASQFANFQRLAG